MFHVVIDVVVAYQQTMLVYLFHFITWAQILCCIPTNNVSVSLSFHHLGANPSFLIGNYKSFGDLIIIIEATMDFMTNSLHKKFLFT
jgi:hypothetical protein